MADMAGSRAQGLTLDIAGRTLTVTHPDKVVFETHQGRPPISKLDLIEYYLAVADGALRGVADRPMILKRFVKGITEEAVFQKRAPAKRPDYVDVAELKYASGTSAKEAVIHDAAGWGGRSTSDASTSTPIRRVRAISPIPTNCGSTSTRCPVSTGSR